MRIYACEETRLVDFLQRSMMIEQRDFQGMTFEEAFQPDGEVEITYETDSDGNTTASIGIYGILTREGLPKIYSIFGIKGTSYNGLMAAIDEVFRREDVNAVNLIIDSPGGYLEGTDETWQAVKNLTTIKPVTAINVGLMASAAYWIGSAANQILASSPVSMTGSIGVVVAQINTEKMEDAQGIKVIEVVSRNAPKKRPDGTTDEGRQVLQDEVDAIERTFIGRVAESRNVTREYVEENFGRGGVLVAHDTDKPSAISVKMIDGLTNASSIPDIIESGEMDNPEVITPNNVTKLTPQNAGNFDLEQKKMLPRKGKEGLSMTLAELITEHPEIKSEIDALKLESFEAGKKEAQEKISAATKYLENNDYPDEIKALACKALKGEQSMDTVQAAVAVADIFIEKKKSNQAAEETEEIGGTPPQNPEGNTPSNDGIIRNKADFDAALARLR